MPLRAETPAGRIPRDFVMGAATAAYQIEGGAHEDGRGRSIWDDFSRTPGNVANGDNGDVAADHYHRLDEDLELMQRLGLDAYRFSIAWPRIVPEGRGAVNEEGIDFYDRLVDGLLERDIDPIATLYHWDLPAALERDRGWRNRSTAFAFAEYAHTMAARLGDRVKMWTTLNEPWCAAFLGHASGEHAPGLRDGEAAFAAVHHLNLAHGLATRALRDAVPAAKVSITLNVHVFRPDGDTGAEAVRRMDGLGNRVFLDPVFHGRYPADVLIDTKDTTDWSFVQSGDLGIINEPIDMLGVNYYSTSTVRLGATGHARDRWAWPSAEEIEILPEAGPLTAMGWNIDPAGLEELLLRLSNDLPDVPLMITENGAAFDDDPRAINDDGVMMDQARIDYLRSHVAAALRARDAGVDLRGYLVWSLLDNFEWAHGYDKRFGIVHVDPVSQDRTLKTSALWYAGVLESRTLS